MHYVVGDVSPDIGRDYLSYSLLTFVLPDFPPGTPVQEARLNLEACRFFGDDPLEHDVEVTLRGDEVPETPLGKQETLGRLSWTTWLKSQPCEDKSVIFGATG